VRVKADRRAAERVDPAIWQRQDMRAALATRDIGCVFRLLQRFGVSQRRIAALTGQSQSEVSEILGGRQVVSYDVLTRVADGLGVPRGHLGLAYDPNTAELVGSVSVSPDDLDVDEPRQLVSRLTEVTVGAAKLNPETWSTPFALSPAPALNHVGTTDVERLRGITARLRSLDREYGGGHCREAVVAQVGWAQQLLRATANDDVSRTLHLALADLHNLAGWTSFDVGLVAPARRHFARALEHARYVDEPSLVAKVLYCMGRLHLHHGWGAEALRLFQLGLLAAQESAQPRAIALLSANEAWAHATLGDTRMALVRLSRARDEYARTDREQQSSWLEFVNAAEMQALRATTLAFLPNPTDQQRSEAVERLYLSTALRELTTARSRAFELTTLSYALFLEGNVTSAVEIGNQAIDLAVQVRSQRVVDRFAALRATTDRYQTNSYVRDLAERVHRFHTTGAA
jgi:transcriptional regulator with XRE-family HTH domain/tetratricopeptide (TPR) repeat protein